MARLYFFKPGAVGKAGVSVSLWRVARPRRAACLILALASLYCLFASWSKARHIASVLQQVDIIKDDRGIGVVLRLDGGGTQRSDEDAFDETQLPFDDISIVSRKSDAEIRAEFEKEYKEAGRLVWGIAGEGNPERRSERSN